MRKLTVGSVCSGIEACSVAWAELPFQVSWLSEIASFPKELLSEKYPNIPNLGDMNLIPELIDSGVIKPTDVICGGTPCQAFSLAGWKKGLNDDRGNLTIKFVDIVNSNDKKRIENGLDRTIVFWENVEGVLKDKTNAFGCFIASLIGMDKPIQLKKWPNAGLVRGPIRNVAWRVLDAKYFGLPQQRRRLYVVATGKDRNPEEVLFEQKVATSDKLTESSLKFEKDNHQFEVFRSYTDCLYSAYGTKWNGNAAANNGSLFVVQDGRIRRFSPLECERLMGFPDRYTEIQGARKTNRYQALGNSWAVPVIRWIGMKIVSPTKCSCFFSNNQLFTDSSCGEYELFVLDDKKSGIEVNCSDRPNKPIIRDIKDVVEVDAPNDIYISPVGCYGILRRAKERNAKINLRLKEVLTQISSELSHQEIERKSRVQKRSLRYDIQPSLF